jgi:hypothetical protein
MKRTKEYNQKEYDKIFMKGRCFEKKWLVIILNNVAKQINRN